MQTNIKIGKRTAIIRTDGFGFNIVFKREEMKQHEWLDAVHKMIVDHTDRALEHFHPCAYPSFQTFKEAEDWLNSLKD
ncbi:MAG: hypothetical protein ACOVOP_05365 [Candidatus Planktophila sp.]